MSNHHPNITKNLPAGISRRLSDISHDKEIFAQTSPINNEALKSNGYSEQFSYSENPLHPKKCNHKLRRKSIWLNLSISKNDATNVGSTFLGLIARHFPRTSKQQKISNKNTMNVSYSCMLNMASIINAHNMKTAPNTYGN